MYQQIKLKDDYLDRGEYAMTLFNIIADYAPKTPYEIVGGDDEDIGEINEEEIKYEDYDPNEGKWNVHLLEAKARTFEFVPQQTEQAEKESEYTIKLNYLDNEAFVIAISGSWGSGKTTFVKNLFDLLHGKGYEKQEGTETEQFIQRNKYEKGQVAYFDAWKNDFHKDPILPFSRMILKTLCMNEVDYKKAADTIIETYQKMLEAKLEGIGDYYKKDETEENIKKLKSLLRDSVRGMDQSKVVIIIDELDRCKPTFAVQLLEIVKHLFNVKGIVFIFALDINQLQHCVKTVYGDEFDAIGYLERFFDYYSLLPKGSDEKLFRKFADEYDILEDVESFYEMCKQFNLTPREMKGICSSFYYLNKYQLKGYPLKARQLCFYLLLLKHRYPERIHSLSAKGMKEERKKFFEDKIPDCLKVNGISNEPFLTAIVGNDTIKQTKLVYINEKGVRKGGRKYDFTKPLNDAGSLSYIIYAQDYKKDIGDMRVLEYLFDKVETFGNAIPMEVKEEKIKRGKRLTFGRWHRDTEKDMEPIEWIVLDRQEDRVLLVSKYAIDCLPYNNYRVGTTWKECSLRKWLNEEFLEKAFSQDEKGLIAMAKIVVEKNPAYDTNPGNDTEDNVFLLSIQEAGKYFENDEKRICKPTEYARKKMIEGYKLVDETVSDEKKKYITFDEFIKRTNNSNTWWLRSPGRYGSLAARVYLGGGVDAFGCRVSYDDVGVRPALWLILNPKSSNLESPQSDVAAKGEIEDLDPAIEGEKQQI